MRSSRIARLMAFLLCSMMVFATGCGGGSGPRGGGAFTRRGVEREYLSTPALGAARGLSFEDIIPIGARITAVHVAVDQGGVTGIWTSYERNGVVKETPHRGQTKGRVEVFKLHGGEKLIGIDGRGRGRISELTIATNKRTRTFGRDLPDSERTPWYDTLTGDNRYRYVGVGFAGRADRELNQISLRIQVRREALASADG